MTQQIHSHTFENGLTLLAEEMPWLESAAFTLMIPAGGIYDPPHRRGLANLTSDMVQRGAGERNSRQLVEALERLGIDHSVSVSTTHTSVSGSMLADNLLAAIPLQADIVMRPRLPADQVEESRQVCLQEIRASEDDLAHKVMDHVKELIYPAPWGRPVQGTVDDVEQISHQDLEGFFHRYYQPSQAIFSVAGKVDWPRLRDAVAASFGDWKARPVTAVAETPAAAGHLHLEHDSNQTHIAVAYPSVPYRHEDFYQARAAVGIMSDGMSSRLFTKVREERGLCYTVYASSHTLRDRGAVLCYSGTSSDRAQETLDVLLAELRLLRKGVDQAELDRLKARIKSGLIMQQESSSTRSMSMAIDWYHLQQVRTLDEVSAKIDALGARTISDYLSRNPPDGFRVVSLGARPLEVNLEVS